MKESNSGIRLKITGIAAVFALIAAIALLIINIFGMDDINLEVAVLVGENRLKGDLIHFISMLDAEHGSLSLQNGELIDESGNSIAYRYNVIDHLSHDLGIIATISVKENNDYRRIATSIVNSNGERIVDTFLDSESLAYASIQSGEDYIGKTDILGKDYLTMYHPIFQHNMNDVIGYLVVGVEMEKLQKIIAQKTNMRSVQTITTRIVLIALGTMLAVILITMVFHISAEKNSTDERIKIMFNAMPLSANIHNKNFDYFDCNDGALKMFGLSSKQEYLDNFYQLSPEYQPDGLLSKDKMIENIDRAFADGFCRLEWMHQKLNGGLIPCEVTLVRVKHNDEYALAVYMRDLREIKSAITQMNESKRSLNILTNVLNGIDAMIYVTIPDTGEILFINDRMKEEFNIDWDCVGQHCYKVFMNGVNQRCDFCPCYQLDKEPNSTVVWERRNEKTNRIYHNTDRYIEWYDGKIVFVQHSIDVTELIEAKELAERSNHYKSQFLSRMSHEVRTPMNAILGITEIQLQNEMLPTDTHEALDKIYNSGYLLLGIINDILDLSKIEAGKLELMPVNYDMSSLINDTVYLNIIRYDSKPIGFNLFVDENIPVKLFGDEMRIKQILNNLLSNAFKYTQEGEVTLSINVEYDPHEKSSDVIMVFKIADTGQGMTAEQVEMLFDEYVRFNMAANRTTEGAGLGMSITRQIVNMMNGNILVESEYGKGSVFTVRLPQVVSGDGVLGKEAVEDLKQFNLSKTSQIKKTTQIIREYMPYGRVLIVDDVETNIYVARGLLAPYGLSVETALSGFETIEKIKSGVFFDIIFMDHYMPKMDGIETTKILRENGYKNPIVALTANALAGQADIFLENGFDGFISKPIDLRQLNVTLNKLIRDKYPPETVEAARRQASKINMAKSIPEKEQPLSDHELAAIFIRDAEKIISRLDKMLSNSFRRNDDIRQYVIDIHSVKSALANIGETELSAAALKLEQAGRIESISEMVSKTPTFLKALKEVVEKNRPKDEKIEIENSDAELAYLAEKMLVIRAACDKYDELSANKVIDELKQKKWSHSIKKILDTIDEYLLHSDFEEAAKLAKNYGNI